MSTSTEKTSTEKSTPEVSTGAGLAIAGIWIACVTMAIFIMMIMFVWSPPSSGEASADVAVFMLLFVAAPLITAYSITKVILNKS